MPGAQRGVVQVAPRHRLEGRQPTVEHHHGGRRGLAQAQGPVQQRLVRHDLARARTAVGAHDHLGRGIVDALRQVDRGEAAEHHRMHRADAGAGQHGEDGLRHHGHVQQDAVAAFHAQFLEHGGGGVDLFIDILARVDPFAVHLGGHPDQRRIFRLRGQPSVDGVVTDWSCRPRTTWRRAAGRSPARTRTAFPNAPGRPARARKRPGRVSIGNGNPWFLHGCLLLSCIRLLADCFCFKLLGHSGGQTLHEACRRSKILPRVYAARAPGWLQ